MEGTEGGNLNMEEILETVKEMKNGKSSDMVHTHEIYEKRWLIRCIIYLMTWSTGKKPTEWGKALMCPLLKEEECHEFENYRSVTLSPDMSEIYERILKQRLRRNSKSGNMALDLEEPQQTWYFLWRSWHRKQVQYWTQGSVSVPTKETLKDTQAPVSVSIRETRK